MRKAGIFLLLLILTLPLGAQGSDRLKDIRYNQEFFPGTEYDSAIPTPEELLGFKLGDRAAFPAEIEACLKRWDEESPRTRLVEYARSHEGRALHYMVVTSPANLEKLDAIKEGIGRLADPRGLSDAEGKDLVESLPAIAWMAYSIHGDETSGSDASLAVLYHLIAGTSPEVTDLLDNVVVLVDSMENPDGRHRFLQMIAEHRATEPNVDDQSLLHRGYWPRGRANHYLFDLNRDWILGVHPESRGRIEAAGQWHPQLLVDAHEMGSQGTFLFSPSRGPRNPYVPKRALKWAETFARNQSQAFDEWHWPYYTGEWNEGWYPGYTDAWGGFRGAIGILYEQARYAEDGVRLLNGDINTYGEALHHQATSSLSNLETLKENRRAVLADFWAGRQESVSTKGHHADRVFAVLPTANQSRLQTFLELMDLQGFEIYQTSEEINLKKAKDQYGDERAVTLPQGSFLLPNRQPEAQLLSTMLDFDSRMTEDYLERERTSILRQGSSTIYDATSWNLTMLHSLEAVSFQGSLPASAKAYRPETPEGENSGLATDAVAYFVSGADDRSPVLAGQLLRQGVEVQVARKDVSLGDGQFPRGSLMILPKDNRRFEGDLVATLRELATAEGLSVETVTTGLGDGDLPDIGGGHFERLENPSIALVGRGSISSYDYGAIWHLLDMNHLAHSQLDNDSLSRTDLRRYNVLVLPNRWGGTLSAGARDSIETWVKAGGTLIAIAGSAKEMAQEEGLSSARPLSAVLTELDDYDLAVLRELMAAEKALPTASSVWSHEAVAGGSFPWAGLEELKRPEEKELKRQDEWAQLFMPQGAFLAARSDGEHWLTFGLGERSPVYVNQRTVLMAKGSVEAPVRLGVFENQEGTAVRRVGWSTIPKDKKLKLRMSGLLWPEAAARLANSAAVTRERVGRGQVILFANTPNFRGSTKGTARVLLNAIIYGPGLGSRPAIRLHE